jgi:hypothetical protein
MGKSRSLSNMSRQAFGSFATREGTPPGPSATPQLRTFLVIQNSSKDNYVMAITVAEKVLIAGGMLNLAYGRCWAMPS